MNYIGSKHKLSPFITETIHRVVGADVSDRVFCDLFAGTGIVGRSFKSKVQKVISNDLEYYSYVLNKNYIENTRPIEAKDHLIAELNALPLQKGFIYRNYCRGGQGERQYFSDENGQKIDAIRLQIENWKKQGSITEASYYFLLASLIESADKVANTASVYGAYLKHLKKSAQKAFVLQAADFELSSGKHQVYQTDSNTLIRKIQGDILYLDPPYNARQYGANYHILNTIALYDSFIPKGKTGLRTYQKSRYCSKVWVQETFEDLIQNASFPYIFLSYNNEGLLSPDTIRKIMSRYGTYSLVSTPYQRFKADSDRNRKHMSNSTEEFLHILVKD